MARQLYRIGLVDDISARISSICDKRTGEMQTILSMRSHVQNNCFAQRLPQIFPTAREWTTTNIWGILSIAVPLLYDVVDLSSQVIIVLFEIS